MRVLGPIVEPLVLAVTEPKVHRRSRGPIRSELVCDHDARRRDGGFEEFSHEPPRGLGVPSALDQDVENEAF